MLALRRTVYRWRASLSADRRRRLAPLLALWQDSALSVRRPWQQQEWLVMDCEMSSLDVQQGELLSAGWVVIGGGRIRLSSAGHWLLKPQQGVGDSATIHSLRDCELAQGLTEAEFMQRFLQAVAGRVLVFHHAQLDLAYLNRCSRRLFGAPLLLPVADTLALERRALARRDTPLRANSLRLASCRARYGLPPGWVHNALTDALATAELLLAQISHKGGRLRVGDLLD